MKTITLTFTVLVLGCSDAAPTVDRRASALTAEQCEYFAADGKVQVCHKTSSTKHPYQIVKISDDMCIDVHADHADDYVAVDDPSCQGLGCLPAAAPCDDTVPCCEGTSCVDGTCQVPPPACTSLGAQCGYPAAPCCDGSSCVETLSGSWCMAPTSITFNGTGCPPGTVTAFECDDESSRLHLFVTFDQFSLSSTLESSPSDARTSCQLDWTPNLPAGTGWSQIGAYFSGTRVCDSAFFEESASLQIGTHYQSFSQTYDFRSCLGDTSYGPSLNNDDVDCAGGPTTINVKGGLGIFQTFNEEAYIANRSLDVFLVHRPCP